VSARRLPEEDVFRLKAAARDLIKRAGGVERAGHVAGVGKSEAARWQSPAEVSLPPLSAVVLLERDAGAPLITGVMASLQGSALAEGRAAGGPRFPTAHARLARAMAELQAGIIEAIHDGVLTTRERAEIERQAAATAETLAIFRRANAAGLEEG